MVLYYYLGDFCTPGSSVFPHEDKVLHDLKELFLKKENCDVVIKVKGQEFPAHKIILEARSPVFASTFRNDMKERATGIVEIEDCDPSCFSNFLCFLYCGDGGISQENVFSLFTVADKYDVQDLRTKCLEFIKNNLSIDTFCDTITLALQHSETELIKLSTDFFTKNAPKIIVTVKWQVFSAENPTQSNELFIKLLVPDVNLSK